MKDQVCKLVQLTGTSTTAIEDAVALNVFTGWNLLPDLKSVLSVKPVPLS